MSVFVEGGGKGKDRPSQCRRAFGKLFEKAGLAGRLPRVVCCGARYEAFDSFTRALRSGDSGREVLLLVDSETAVSTTDPWEHVAQNQQDQWKRPAAAKDEQLHLMVQVMESWFLADPETVAEFFGRGFQASKLPRRTEIEAVAKEAILSAIEREARRSPKRRYSKGAHSFAILERLDPAKLRRRSPWAERFFGTLERLLEG